jgi:hypothetical protein
VEQLLESYGLPGRDTCLIAHCSDIGIWHSEDSAWNRVPSWRPPFGTGHAAIYRGFAVEKLRTVLTTGLDVPSGAAFFATPYADKAWEYPGSPREIAMMLVLDASQAAPSFVAVPPGGGVPVDTAAYPTVYRDGDWTIHSRFVRPRGTGCFLDEQMYGHWIPGDARAALLGVVIGGPRAAVMDVLHGLAGAGAGSALISVVE